MQRNENGIAQTIDHSGAVVGRGILIALARQQNAKALGLEGDAEDTGEVQHKLTFDRAGRASCAGIRAAVRGIDHHDGNPPPAEEAAGRAVGAGGVEVCAGAATGNEARTAAITATAAKMGLRTRREYQNLDTPPAGL